MLNGEFYTARLCTIKKEPSSVLTLNSWVTEDSHTLSPVMSQDVCVLDCSLKVSVPPNTRIFECV